MVEYDYGYKHLQLVIGSHKIIIELSEDNMFGEKSYAAKSNLSFYDNETWGRACGVGDSENEALAMCFEELENYLKLKFDKTIIDNITIFNIPKRITIEYKKHIIILFVKIEEDKQIILTNNNRIEIDKDVDIVNFISKNIKQFAKNYKSEITKDYLAQNGFTPVFDDLSEKYQSGNAYLV